MKYVSFVQDIRQSDAWGVSTEKVNCALEEKFKFRKAYCDMQVFYKPWFGMAVKVLFPFRRLIKHPKVAAILRQEAWARGMPS